MGYTHGKMKTSEVLSFYKTQKAIASALGIKQPSVCGWGEYPPDKRQIQIEAITGGELKAERSCFASLLGIKQES